MRLSTKSSILATVIAVVLCAVQAGIWAHSTAHLNSQTAEQNKEIRHPPSEMAGVAGLSLLAVTCVLLSLPDTSPFEFSDDQEDLPR
jgi:hypothetical protein